MSSRAGKAAQEYMDKYYGDTYHSRRLAVQTAYEKGFIDGWAARHNTQLPLVPDGWGHTGPCMTNCTCAVAILRDMTK